MSFKLNEFLKAKMLFRTGEVKLPELKEWFEEGTEPVFIVRGLPGEEFYLVRQAEKTRSDLQAIAASLLSGQGEAIAEAIEAWYGAVPGEYARMTEILVHGCVDPAMDRPAAVKFLKEFPVQAHTVGTEILRLTGEGASPGESKGSGGTPASATTSLSPTSGENVSLS